MNKINKIVLALLVIGMITLSSCSKNYYSGTGKGGKNCGCPSQKGM